MIKFHNVIKVRENIRILDNVSFEISKGSCCLLHESNENMLSAIVDCIAGNDKIDDGKIIVDDVKVYSLKGVALRAYKRSISFISENSIINRRDSIFDNVSLPLLGSTLLKDDFKQRVVQALEDTGLLNISGSNCLKLTAYTALLLNIAKAIAKHSKLIILKEPFLKLSLDESLNVISLIKKIYEKYKQTILIATSDKKLLKEFKADDEFTVIKVQSQDKSSDNEENALQAQLSLNKDVEFRVFNYLISDGDKKESIYSLLTHSLPSSFRFSGRIVYESDKNIKEEFLLSVVAQDENKVLKILNRNNISFTKRYL